MPDGEKLGVPKQDVFTKEEVTEMFKSDSFSRGTYVFDIDGKGTYKISRLQKQWVQKN